MSVPGYADYRDSGVQWLGAAPSHWDIVRLRRLVEIKKRIAGEEGPDVLSITQRGIKVRDTTSNDGQLASSYAHYQLVEPGDFAMNHMDLLTGWVDIAPQHGVTSPDYRVFSVRRDARVDPRYLLRVLQLGYIGRTFFALGQGSSHLGRWRLPADAFNDFEVAFPPIAEQVAIAAFLDRETAKIDALVEVQRRLIELLKDKRQAVISHAVTKGLDPSVQMKDSGVEWLGEVPAHWRLCRLKHLGTFNAGAGFPHEDQGTEGEELDFHKVNALSRADREGCLVPSENTISQEVASRLRAFIFPAGSIVFAKIGAALLLGRIRKLRKPACLDNNMMGLTVAAGVNVAFVASLLSLVRFDLIANPGTVPSLNEGQIANVAIAVPSAEEQGMIATFIAQTTDRLDALQGEAEQAIALLQERRSALISAAVTGKIDVRGLVSEQAEAA